MIFKKILILLCATLFIGANVNAQFVVQGRSPSIKHKVDTCKYAIVYNYKFVRDTVQKNACHDKQILEVGNNIIKYSSIYADKIDNFWHDIRVNRKNRQRKDGSDGYNAEKEVGMKSNEEAIYADYYTNYPRNGMLTVSTDVWYKEYVYEEPVPKQEWQISADTTTVLGYTCIKATTSFRGRTYIAWFTPSIPMRYGPWKFNGLPGLILKAADTEGLFEWTAIGIEQSQNKDMYIINFDVITKFLIKTERKDVIKLLHKRWDDPVGLGMANIPADFKGAWSFSDPLTGKKATVSHAMPIDKNVRFSYIPIPELE